MIEFPFHTGLDIVYANLACRVYRFHRQTNLLKLTEANVAHSNQVYFADFPS